LRTVDNPIHMNEWQHVTAVFESNVPWNNATWPTNELRLYLNGQHITNALLNTLPTSFTGESPFRDLDPGYSPGVTIGNRSRSDGSEPFVGFMDEVTVYARALTEPEITAIVAAGSVGKGDPGVAPSQSLAKVNVSIDGSLRDVSYADNSKWTT